MSQISQICQFLIFLTITRTSPFSIICGIGFSRICLSPNLVVDLVCNPTVWHHSIVKMLACVIKSWSEHSAQEMSSLNFGLTKQLFILVFSPLWVTFILCNLFLNVSIFLQSLLSHFFFVLNFFKWFLLFLLKKKKRKQFKQTKRFRKMKQKVFSSWISRVKVDEITFNDILKFWVVHLIERTNM